MNDKKNWASISDLYSNTYITYIQSLSSHDFIIFLILIIGCAKYEFSTFHQIILNSTLHTYGGNLEY